MTGGVLTALDEAMEGLEDGADAVQAALFGPEEIGALDAPSPLSAAVQARPRKAGRPPGSRNRRTEAVAGWLLSQHRHPVAAMMEAYSMTPAQLAQQIGLKPVSVGEDLVPQFDNDELIELFKLQMKMAEASAAYVAQKMPQAVQVSGGAALQVTIGGVSVPARGASAVGAAAAIEGEVMGVRLAKSDDASRTDD